jgi:uncharacterized protein YjbI with pentapeptide repeats
VQFLAGPREVRHGVTGILLWLIAIVSLVIGPVVLLVYFQLQFLPYHDSFITWCQRFAVVIDLLFLWILWLAVRLHKRGATEKGAARRRRSFEMAQRILTIVGMLLISIGSVLLVFTIATIPGEPLENGLKQLELIPLQRLREALVEGKVDTAARKPKSVWSNRLVLPGLDVIDHTKLDTEEKIGALPVTASLRGRHLEGAVLLGAGLRKVDFTAAHLQDARLEQADLRSAKLECAQLWRERQTYDEAVQRASRREKLRLLQNLFLESSKNGGEVSNCTQLEGAHLDGAQLQGASLNGAQFQGASLVGAPFQGALLIHAYLQGASLNNAQFQGALLYGAQLQGASLNRAQFQGASLVRAQFQGAVLDGAQLQGAALDGAGFDGASLLNVSVWRADPRKAGAKLARISITENYIAASLSSLKQRIEQEVPKGPLRMSALERIDPRLDWEVPLSGEEQMAEKWKELQRNSATDAYEAERYKQWRRIGCGIQGAPYVLEGLIRTISDLKASNLLQLADDFLKPDCAGASGLSDDAKKRLFSD